MAVYSGELGLQFTTHIANHYTVPQWVELAELARENNFDQVWVNDNLGYRNVFVILTAISVARADQAQNSYSRPLLQEPGRYSGCVRAALELVDGYEKALPLIGCVSFGDFAPSWSETLLPRERLPLTDS